MPASGWQTSGSIRVVRLAFNLYTDGTLSVGDYEGRDEQVRECREYSVSDIFCCGYSRFFLTVRSGSVFREFRALLLFARFPPLLGAFPHRRGSGFFGYGRIQ